MPRFSMTQDQINLLDRDSLYSLLDEINQELVNLTSVEYMIYSRRRQLELAENPELGLSTPPLPLKEEKSLDIESLLQQAHSQGVDITSLLQPFIK